MMLRKLMTYSWVLVALSCGATSRRGAADREPAVNPGGGAGGDGVGGMGEGGADGPAAACLAGPALTRLTFREQLASVRALLGDELADELAELVEVGDRDSSFPPLMSPREGTVITDTVFATGELVAQRIGRYAREHFEATLCGAADFDCVREYVSTLGERAFRRPLSAEEQSALLLPVERAEALSVTAAEALEYGVYAVFASPHFLYRTEFGAVDPDVTGGERSLSGYELASTLSFFLTGEPPDEALLDAASADALSTEQQVREQAERLLKEPRSRAHLQRLLASYFQLSRLPTLVLDSALYPGFSATLRKDMQLELEGLLESTLRGGSVGELLTTRGARINAGLAELYGVSFPPPGVALDARGFAEVELPETRAGLLTRAGWAAMYARPDGPSVVGRAVALMSSVYCQPLPPFMDAVDDESAQLPNPTERERAEARMRNAACRDCHQQIDPLGLALEDLDALGRYRTVDEQGRPIDATVALPEYAGGVTVTGARGLSVAIPEQVFAGCVSRNLLQYALSSSTRPSPDTCARDALEQSQDLSIDGLMLHIASSRAFRRRSDEP
ncbi:MAG: DUF1592 domain-containing protein [Myxococcales bacterium]|nr:MAG: DUF1592 domain-containing protein [Myxococcales bacterium]